MQKKRFIISFIILILILLSGCSKNQKEFTIWIGGSPEEVNYWQELVNRFNVRTNSDLQLIRQPTYTDQRKQSLIVSLESKQNDPDLFLMDVVWLKQFIESGWLLSLDTLLNEKDFSIDNFFPSVINSVDKSDSHLFALPVFLDVGLLYYRKDLLKKYGFDSPPDTWSNLIKESEVVQEEEKKTNSNFYGFVWQGAQYEGLICDFVEFISSNGGGILQNGTITLNSPENIYALKFMQDLIHKYKVSPENTYTDMKEEEVRRAFQNCNALFERNWSYAYMLHNDKDSPVNGKTGMAVLPHFKDHQTASALGGWHIGISKYTDQREKALQFIKYVTSFEVQKNLFTSVGWNPGRKDVYFDKELQKNYPRIKILYAAFQHAVARPMLPYYNEVSDIIQRHVNQCLAGKISPSNALNKSQEEIQSLENIYNINR
jgi:trehalose/maltose transport system substrate-binding protein